MASIWNRQVDEAELGGKNISTQIDGGILQDVQKQSNGEMAAFLPNYAEQ